MRVITRAVMDIETGRWEEVEAYEYLGPIANCKGGGSTSSTTTTVDYAYNARMAALSERQQAMAEEYFKFWEKDYKPMEQAQIAANMSLIPTQVGAEKAKSELEQAEATAKKGLLPSQTALAEEQISAARGLLPTETEYKKGVFEAGIAETQAATPVMAEYYKQALRGVDPNQRVQQARADVAGSFEGVEGSMARSMGRYGIQMGSERMAEMARQKAISQAKATGAAMTGARLGAEEENFQRLSGATSAFKGGLKGI